MDWISRHQAQEVLSSTPNKPATKEPEEENPQKKKAPVAPTKRKGLNSNENTLGGEPDETPNENTKVAHVSCRFF
jgi:hypothetical protein